MYDRLFLKSGSFHLKSRNKYIVNNGNVSSRIKSAEDTLAEIIPLCKKIGVTRISDITYMDKLYIPNYTAVLPGTQDSIWVYSGKGRTKATAKAGALMESIERYSSLSSNYSKSFIQGSYLQLAKSYNKVLHPDEVVEPVEQTFDCRNSIADFLPGFDLLNNEEVLVPVQTCIVEIFCKTPGHACISILPYKWTCIWQRSRGSYLSCFM